MKVLIVDDSSTMRRIITNTISAIGYKDVVQAVDGVEALETLSNDSNIGLILCDWHMPVLDGFSVLKKVKAHPSTKDIPFMMVTTQMEQASVVEAINAGAAGYIVKPFTPEVLRQKIQTILR